jgi:hypothetical protein
MPGTQRYELLITWTPVGMDGKVPPTKSLVLVNAPDSKSAVSYAMREAALAGSEIPLDANIRSVSL